MVRTLPSGTVTFLFTDVEGSTRLWERHGELMRQAQRRHDDLLRDVIRAETGAVVKTMGDGLMAAFGDARAALRAAIAGQRALLVCDWDPLPPLRVRMGLHTAEATPVAGDYHGSPVNRAARIADAAHGGQVLASGSTAAAGPPEGAQLVSLGRHRLRDLGEPLELFQVRADGLPDDVSGTRTLRAGIDNLPIQRTSFVGRREEISEIAEALLAHRIVTLTGLGGVGKSRLALQTAAEVVFRFRHGVRLVELAPLPAGAEVAEAVIDALELGRDRRRRPRVTGDALDRLIAYLRPRSLLLVLDNCEHLASQCAEAVDEILKHCRQVAVLATSRSPLGLSGEHLYPLAPLSPPLAQATEGGLASDAFELFVDRASAARPKLDASRDLEAIARICCQLDGIPLAIELAAARVAHLSPREIAARLDDQMHLLASRERTATARHRTLVAALDWSHELLDPDEQAVFRRMSVFSTGAPLEAIEAVCGSGRGANALDVVSGLVDGSLVIADAREGSTRYRMLDTVRRYAAEKLAATGEGAKVHTAHAKWFVERLESAARQVDDAAGARLLRFLADENVEVLAALRRALAAGDAELACRLAGQMWKWWEVNGRYAEGRQLLAAALGLDQEPSAARSRALSGAANLAFVCGDYVQARELHERNLQELEELDAPRQVASTLSALSMVVLFGDDLDLALDLARRSLELFRELGDDTGMAFALSSLGQIESSRGDHERANENLLESLNLFRRAGHKRDAASVLTNLGALAHDRGDLGRAFRFYEGALQLNEEVEDRRGAALSLNNLSIVARERGDLDRATELAEAALDHFAQIGDRPGQAATLNNLANLAGEQANPSRAVELYQRSIQLFRDIPDQRGVATSLENLSDLATRNGDGGLAWNCRLEAVSLRVRLGQSEEVQGGLLALARSAGELGFKQEAARLNEAHDEGPAFPLLELLRELRSIPLPELESDRKPEPSTDQMLTRRERQVARLVARGLANKEIAAELFVSERTVEAHISNIRAKLDIDSRTKLVRYALEHGLA